MSLGQSVLEVLDPEEITHSESIFQRKRQCLGEEAAKTLASDVLQSIAERYSEFPAAGELPGDDDIDRLCRALISDKPDSAQHIVQLARDAGASLDLIYLGYLATAARRLGMWWDQDRVSSSDVVLGTGRIYGIMRTLRPVLGKPSPSRHALFAAVPGETHTLGIGMAADMLRERGWDIHLCLGETHDALVNCLGTSDHFIVGLTASRSSMLLPLARLVVALRIKRPEAFILVSGHITALEPELPDLLDADLVAHSAEQAIISLEKLIEPSATA